MTSNNALTPDPTPQNLKSNVWLKITLVIGLVFLLALVYLLWLSPYLATDATPNTASPDSAVPVSNEVNQDTSTDLAKTEGTKDTTASPITAESDKGGDDKSNDDTATTTEAALEIPSPNAILKAPLPTTDSLAKEEIDRLNDEQSRLAEQEVLATEQIEMTKELADLNDERIRLLEQQIAQLEANAAS